MHPLSKRLDRIEQVRDGSGRMYVVEIAHDADHDRALKELGLSPTRDDLVVFLERFGEPAARPTLISTRAP